MSGYHHTKGDWSIAQYDSHMSIKSAGKTVAQVAAMATTRETEHNARLLAAAPRLLAVVRRFVGDEWMDGNVLDSEALRIGRRVLQSIYLGFEKQESEG